MQQGTVVKWCGASGYGFVHPDDGSDDVFVHVSCIGSGGELVADKPVCFAAKETALGHRRAMRVTGPGVVGGRDELPELSDERRRQLQRVVEEFASSSARERALDSDLNPAERFVVHEHAEQRGLFTQSLGSGMGRKLFMSKETPSGGANKEASPVEDRALVKECVVELTDESAALLKKALGGRVAAGWTLDCGSILLCDGPVERADNGRDRRGIADELGEKVRSLKPGQAVSATVVAVGKDADGTLLTAGVLGCPSVFPSPHVVVARAPEFGGTGTKFGRGTSVTYEPLSSDECFGVFGHVCERKKLVGVVKTWKEKFGFLKQESGSDVHFNLKSLATKGQRVEMGWKFAFEMEQGREGKPHAKNMVRVT